MSGKNKYKILRKNPGKVLLLLCGLFISPAVFAAQGPPEPQSINNPFALTLVIIMFVLLLAIVILANVVINLAGFKEEKEKKEKKSSKTGASAAILAGLILLSSSVFAQDAASVGAPAQAASSIGGLSPTAFWAMISVIAIEIVVLFVFIFFMKSFLAKEKAKVFAEDGSVVYKPKSTTSWWNKLNKFKPIELEADIDLGHDYDGIRELDNRLPPWWLYGFYITILFAVVYLWRFHVAHSAPLSAEELKIEMAKADEQNAEYLKKAANLIDESNVKLLTDPADLTEGKKIFTNPAFCVACHKADGGGLVGPNLTDDYWIHGGSISDIFKTIKYGWPDKGMKSWKDDLSPQQIAQVASYVKSLHGTNPPDAKAPDGTLYTETAAIDSTQSNTKTDSTTTNQ